MFPLDEGDEAFGLLTLLVQQVSSNSLARAANRCAPRVALDDLRVWAEIRMASYSCPCKACRSCVTWAWELVG